ncbi:hypothetical protein N7470_008255 [Penicillium chermesinum]|nr:hypothetical protein N7470_008255 [Penicillium chermesinum]
MSLSPGHLQAGGLLHPLVVNSETECQLAALKFKAVRPSWDPSDSNSILPPKASVTTGKGYQLKSAAEDKTA